MSIADFKSPLGHIFILAMMMISFPSLCLASYCPRGWQDKHTQSFKCSSAAECKAQVSVANSIAGNKCWGCDGNYFYCTRSVQYECMWCTECNNEICQLCGQVDCPNGYLKCK